MNRTKRNRFPKRALAVMLALILLIGAVPLVCAQPAEEGWLIYCANENRQTFDAVFVAPAKYTRVADRPQIETIYAPDQTQNSVLTATAEQIQFSFGGKTETRWTLTATCTIPDGTFSGHTVTCAVSPGSLLDDAGNGNARIWFDEEVEYRSAEGYVDIDVFSGLLQTDYDREDDTVAVGDTLRVEYSGLYPVEIFVNEQQVAAFPGGEMQQFTFDVTETGALNVAVRQYGKEIAAKSLTVVTSQEMYRRNLRGSLLLTGGIPTVKDFVEVGVPAGSLYIPLFTVVAFFVELKDFFQRLFSFTRITK